MATGAEPLGHPPYYPHGGTYADFLCWHMDYWGTRPKGNTTINDQPWSDAEFKTAIFGKSINAESHRVLLRNWRGGGPAPNSTNSGLIEKELFGGSPVFDQWRNDLEDARKRSPKGKNVRTREFPTPPAVVEVKASLPHLTPHFTGRDSERDALVAALVAPEGSRAVLVQGGPGIGKTELTKAIVHHPAVAERFGNRRWFVRLETAPSADATKDAVRRAIGYTSQHDFQGVLHALGVEPSLLVLDNLETPWTVEREKTEELLALLATVPGLVMLASMRGLHAVNGAFWERRPLTELSVDHSTMLFVSIAGKKVQNDPRLINFVGELGGLPLAVDLVARRACGLHNLAPLWNEWLRIGTFLGRRPETKIDRLTSLHCSIELSLEGCRHSASAMSLFRLLGHLPAGIAHIDLQRLLGSNAFDAEECLRLLGLSIQREERVDLLPPIRDYALRIQAYSEVKDTWTVYYLNLSNEILAQIVAISRSNPSEISKKSKKFLGRFINEFSNIEAASRKEISHGNLELTRNYVSSFLHLSQIHAAQTLVFEHLASSWHEAKNYLFEAICLEAASDLAIARTELTKAIDLSQMALSIYTELGDQIGKESCLARIDMIC